MDETTSEYAYRIFSQGHDNDFLKHYLEARYEPLDHNIQLAWIEYCTNFWPGAVKAYLKTHDLRAESIGADANEEAAALYLFDVGQEIANVIFSEIMNMKHYVETASAEMNKAVP